MSDIGDLVLVHFDGQPAFFARIEAIDPDVKRDWFQVRLLMLQVPLKTVTWILRAEYVDGAEFTMGGHPVRIEPLPECGELVVDMAGAVDELAGDGVLRPAPKAGIGPDGDKGEASKGGSKVVSLVDRLKRTDPGSDDVA